MKCWCREEKILCFGCWISSPTPPPPSTIGLRPPLQVLRLIEIEMLEERLAELTQAYVDDAPEYTISGGKRV